MHDCYINKFVRERLNHAVIDSGCTKTACAASWLHSYLECLSEDDLVRVIDNKSSTKFKFGDGKTIASLKSVTTPAEIRNCEITIQADVINNDLPLLMSKDTMKAANCEMDFTCDQIIILRQEIDASNLYAKWSLYHTNYQNI